MKGHFSIMCNILLIYIKKIQLASIIHPRSITEQTHTNSGNLREKKDEDYVQRKGRGEVFFY
jgi:hypothetical protein